MTPCTSAEFFGKEEEEEEEEEEEGDDIGVLFVTACAVGQFFLRKTEQRV
jgi:hypothetical protein